MEFFATLLLSILGGLLANLITPYLPMLPVLFRSGLRKFRGEVLRTQLSYLKTLSSDRFYAYRSIRKDVREALLLWLLSIVLLLYYNSAGDNPQIVLMASSLCFGYGGTGLILVRRMLHKMVFYESIVADLEDKIGRNES